MATVASNANLSGAAITSFGAFENAIEVVLYGLGVNPLIVIIIRNQVEFSNDYDNT